MTEKIKLFLIAAFLTLTLSSQASAFSVSYDQKVLIEKNPVATLKIVVQDDKMWAQSSFSGLDSILLRNETGTYNYIPAKKMATKIPASMDRPNLTRDLPRFMEFLKENGGKKTGSENFDGHACDVYQFIEPTTKRDAKAWVWAEKQFPVKIEVPAPEGLTVVEISNVKFDPVIPASQFQLPSDAKVIDLEASQAAPKETPSEAPAVPAAATETKASAQ